MAMASHWGPTVCLAKTKGLAVGAVVNEEDTIPVRVQDGVTDMIKDFTYLGSSLSRDGKFISVLWDCLGFTALWTHERGNFFEIIIFQFSLRGQSVGQLCYPIYCMELKHG